jgi:hypothetical protein
MTGSEMAGHKPTITNTIETAAILAVDKPITIILALVVLWASPFLACLF